jgi:hypothetical protein
MLVPITIVIASGAVGGVINALMSDNGFIKPRQETVDGETILRPGFAGNILLGAAAAFISWGLYGAFSGAVIYGGVAQAGVAGADEIYVSVSSVAGAVLVGIGGAHWLTNEVDKKLLRSAAVTAAQSKASAQDAKRMAVATPAQAFNIAKKMYQE